jgi:hypothetical protein
MESSVERWRLLTKLGAARNLELPPEEEIRQAVKAVFDAGKAEQFVELLAKQVGKDPKDYEATDGTSTGVRTAHGAGNGNSTGSESDVLGGGQSRASREGEEVTNGVGSSVGSAGSGNNPVVPSEQRKVEGERELKNKEALSNPAPSKRERLLESVLGERKEVGMQTPEERQMSLDWLERVMSPPGEETNHSDSNDRDESESNVRDLKEETRVKHNDSDESKANVLDTGEETRVKNIDHEESAGNVPDIEGKIGVKKLASHQDAVSALPKKPSENTVKLEMEHHSPLHLPIMQDENPRLALELAKFKGVPSTHCSVCSIGVECPEFKEEHVCAYDKNFDAFPLRDAESVYSLAIEIANTNKKRLLRAYATENLVNGGEANPATTQLSQVVLGQLQDVADLLKEKKKVTVTVSGENALSEGGGILSQLFAQKSTKDDLSSTASVVVHGEEV